jgi:hypothetical protein
LPQLFGSLVTSTHAPLQLVSSPQLSVQPLAPQAAEPTPFGSPGQMLPHSRQLFGSLARSEQLLLQHAGSVPVHTNWGPVDPQPPQLPTSLVGSTQPPPVGGGPAEGPPSPVGPLEAHKMFVPLQQPYWPVSSFREHSSSYVEQVTPHPPQFPSTVSSTQVEPQRVWPAGQQLEFAQVSPSGHTLPQKLQLFPSLVVSTHWPGPQRVGVAAGQPETQVELVHTGKLDGHWDGHPPQFAGSLVSSTQTSPHMVLGDGQPQP